MKRSKVAPSDACCLCCGFGFCNFCWRASCIRLRPLAFRLNAVAGRFSFFCCGFLVLCSNFNGVRRLKPFGHPDSTEFRVKCSKLRFIYLYFRFVLHKLCTNSKRIAMGLGALVAICYRRVPSICVPPSVRFFVPILVPFCVPVLGPFCVPVLGPFCVAVLGPFCVSVLGPICVPVLVRFGVPVLARLPSNFGAIWWRTSDRT